MISADLIGIPFLHGGRDYSGLDCAGLALVVLERLGLPAPPLPANGLVDPYRAVEEQAALWERVGASWEDAREPGDVIVTDMTGTRSATHLSVVVRAHPKKVLTTTKGHAVHVARRVKDSQVVGVYRPRAKADRMSEG